MTTPVAPTPAPVPAAAPAPVTVTQHTDFILRRAVVSEIELARLVTELEWVDNELTSLSIRNQSGGPVPMPTLSQGLSDFVTLNKLQLNENKIRAGIVAQLRVLKNTAPVMHMTFAVSADRESLQQLAAWVRREIHPHALIVVGLQPALVAGVYLRTPNHVRDFSLRALLDGRHDLLIKELGALRATK